jgi:hypothetical protein
VATDSTDSGVLSAQHHLAEYDRSPRLHLARVADVILAGLDDDVLALGCKGSKEFVHVLPSERNAAYVNAKIEHRGRFAIGKRVGTDDVTVSADE